MLDFDRGGKLVPFINNSDPLWMNVEDLIDAVFQTNNLIGKLRIYDFILNKLRGDPDPEELFFNSDYLNGDDKNQLYQIGYRVNELRSQFEKPEDLLLFELRNFEKDFSDYLKKEIDKKAPFYEKNLGKFLLNVLDNHGENELFVLSFNYSTNLDSFIEKGNVINIHGTLLNNDIIVGIGDYENGGLPGREMFKKVKRRVQNNLGSMKLPDSKNVKSIIFYGCSFSKQDWNYYKLLFKNYSLEDKKVLVRFLYSDFCSNKTENDKNREKHRQSCTAVVDAYLKESNSSFTFEDLYNLGYIELDAVE